MFRFTRKLTAAFIVLAVGFQSVVLTASAIAQDAPNPALWKISDADSNIYLFGTVHILNPSLKWRTKKVNTAFASANTVVFEAPADDSDPAKMQQLVLKYGINTDGSSLSSKLSPESRILLEETLTSFGMPPGAAANFEVMRPWLVGITLSALQIQATGGDPNAGVEKVLAKEAAQTGKSVGYFESDEQQMQFLSGLSPAAELYFLEDGLRQIKDNPDLLGELVGYWRSGDMQALGGLLVDALAGQDEVYDALLLNRNKDWANQIEAMLAGSGDIFIAVGAAHLAGADSVQSLLSEKGITAVRQ